MVRGRDGRLLLSSLGSGTMRERGGRFETLALPTALPLSVVISIADAPSGDVWLGTRDAGLVTPARQRVSCTSCRDCPTARSTACCRGTTRNCGSAPTRASCGGREGGDDHCRRAGGARRACRRCRWSGIAGRTSGSGPPRASCCGSTPAACRCSLRATAGLAARLPRSSKIATAISGSEARVAWSAIRNSAFVTYSTRQRACRRTASGPIHVDAARPHLVRAVGRRRLLVVERPGPAITEPASRATSVLSTDVVYSIARSQRRTGRVDRPAARRADASPRGERRVDGDDVHQATGLAQNSVYAVHESRDGTVWAGTLSGGVSRFKAASSRPSRPPTASLPIRFRPSPKAPDGTMWFGTPNGVSAFAARPMAELCRRRTACRRATSSA